MAVSEIRTNCVQEILLKVNQSLSICLRAVWKRLGKQVGSFDVVTFKNDGIQQVMPVVAAMTASSPLSVLWLSLSKSGLLQSPNPRNNFNFCFQKGKCLPAPSIHQIWLITVPTYFATVHVFQLLFCFISLKRLKICAGVQPQKNEEMGISQGNGKKHIFVFSPALGTKCGRVQVISSGHRKDVSEFPENFVR